MYCWYQKADSYGILKKFPYKKIGIPFHTDISGFRLCGIALQQARHFLLENTVRPNLSSGDILILKAMKAVSVSLVEHNVTWRKLKTDLVLRPWFEKLDSLNAL